MNSGDKDDHRREISPEQFKENLEWDLNEEALRLEELALQARAVVCSLIESGLGDWADIDICRAVEQFIATGEIPNWWPESYTRDQQLRLRRRLSLCHRFKSRVESRVSGMMIRRIGECQYQARKTLSPMIEELAFASRLIARNAQDPQVCGQLVKLCEVCELVNLILFRDVSLSGRLADESVFHVGDRNLAPGIREFLFARQW